MHHCQWTPHLAWSRKPSGTLQGYTETPHRPLYSAHRYTLRALSPLHQQCLCRTGPTRVSPSSATSRFGRSRLGVTGVDLYLWGIVYWFRANPRSSTPIRPPLSMYMTTDCTATLARCLHLIGNSLAFAIRGVLMCVLTGTLYNLSHGFLS